MGNTVARSHIRDADRGVAKATRANTKKNSAPPPLDLLPHPVLPLPLPPLTPLALPAPPPRPVPAPSESSRPRRVAFESSHSFTYGAVPPDPPAAASASASASDAPPRRARARPSSEELGDGGRPRLALPDAALRAAQTARVSTPPRLDRPPRARKVVSFNENVAVLTYPHHAPHEPDGLAVEADVYRRQTRRRARAVLRLLGGRAVDEEDEGCRERERERVDSESDTPLWVSSCFSAQYDACCGLRVPTDAFDDDTGALKAALHSNPCHETTSLSSHDDTDPLAPPEDALLLASYTRARHARALQFRESSAASAPTPDPIRDDFDYTERRTSANDDTLSLSDAHPSRDAIDEPEAIGDQLLSVRAPHSDPPRAPPAPVFDIAPLWQRLKRVDELDGARISKRSPARIGRPRPDGDSAARDGGKLGEPHVDIAVDVDAPSIVLTKAIAADRVDDSAYLDDQIGPLLAERWSRSLVERRADQLRNVRNFDTDRTVSPTQTPTASYSTDGFAAVATPPAAVVPSLSASSAPSITVEEAASGLIDDDAAATTTTADGEDGAPAASEPDGAAAPRAMLEEQIEIVSAPSEASPIAPADIDAPMPPADGDAPIMSPSQPSVVEDASVADGLTVEDVSEITETVPSVPPTDSLPTTGDTTPEPVASQPSAIATTAATATATATVATTTSTATTVPAKEPPIPTPPPEAESTPPEPKIASSKADLASSAPVPWPSLPDIWRSRRALSPVQGRDSAEPKAEVAPDVVTTAEASSSQENKRPAGQVASDKRAEEKSEDVAKDDLSPAPVLYTAAEAARGIPADVPREDDAVITQRDAATTGDDSTPPDAAIGTTIVPMNPTNAPDVVTADIAPAPPIGPVRNPASAASSSDANATTPEPPMPKAVSAVSLEGGTAAASKRPFLDEATAARLEAKMSGVTPSSLWKNPAMLPSDGTSSDIISGEDCLLTLTSSNSKGTESDRPVDSNGDVAGLDLETLCLPPQDELATAPFSQSQCFAPLAGVFYGTSPSTTEPTSPQAGVGARTGRRDYPEYEMLNVQTVDDSAAGSEPNTPVLGTGTGWNEPYSDVLFNLRDGAVQSGGLQKKDGNFEDRVPMAEVPEVLLHDWSGTTPIEPSVEMVDSAPNSTRSSNSQLYTSNSQPRDFRPDFANAALLLSTRLSVDMSKLYTNASDRAESAAFLPGQDEQGSSSSTTAMTKTGDFAGVVSKFAISKSSKRTTSDEKASIANEGSASRAPPIPPARNVSFKATEAWVSSDYEAPEAEEDEEDEEDDAPEDVSPEGETSKQQISVAPLPKVFPVDQKLHDFQAPTERKTFTETAYRRGGMTGRGMSFAEREREMAVERTAEPSSDFRTYVVDPHKPEAARRRLALSPRRRRHSNLESVIDRPPREEGPFRGVVGRLVSGMHMAKRLVSPN